MYTYLVLIWSGADPDAQPTAGMIAKRLLQSSSARMIAFDAPGAAAFHTGQGEGAAQTLPLADGAGAVFGRIFRRDTPDPAAAGRVVLDASESLRIRQTGSLWLLEHYWGAYVALVRDAATNTIWILRDPTGGMPCMLTKYRGVHLLFSDLEDVQRLGLLEFTVSWPYVREWVVNSGLQARATGLREVSDVQPGERLAFSGDAVQRSLVWHPVAIARSAPLDDPHSAVTQLRTTTRACVHAWAARHSGLLHNLSGGLDSSIVLSCLRDAPSQPRITCLHYFGTGPQEDERKYARLMAAHAGAHLIEHELDPGEVRLERLLRLRRSARPWFYLYELEHGQLEDGLAAEHDAGAVFSGSGGDGVFFQAHADLAVTDYLFDHGLSRGLLRIAADAARISGSSIWPLLYRAVRTRLVGKPRSPISDPEIPRTLINPEVLASAGRDPSLVHPWFAQERTRGVPPGILWHASAVATPPAYYSSFTDCPYRERTMPLLSQPLVELCLRIPTYLLIQSGIDRALARRAFSRDLPELIVRRRGKGRIDQHVRNILDANIGFVREMLLDGRLVKEGLLDGNGLERYLTREHSPADAQYVQILQEYLCLEAWLARWPAGRSGAPDL